MESQESITSEAHGPSDDSSPTVHDVMNTTAIKRQRSGKLKNRQDPHLCVNEEGPVVSCRSSESKIMHQEKCSAC